MTRNEIPARGRPPRNQRRGAALPSARTIGRAAGFIGEAVAFAFLLVVIFVYCEVFR